jgi:hypothetical protein
MTASSSRQLGAAIATSLLLLAGGCAQRDSLQLLYRGPDPRLTEASAKAFADNEDGVYQQLLRSAGLPPRGTADATGRILYQEPTTATEWQQVINAGLNMADEKCDDYLSALHRLDRARRTTSTQLTLTGATTAAIMGLLEASAQAIAITAAAFGYTAATVENLGNSVLYELEPSSVSTMVHKLQNQYRQQLSSTSGFQGRATAFSIVQNYIRICLPSQIEAEVNSSIRNSGAFGQPGDPASGQPPAVSTNPEVVAFRPDTAANRIRGIIYPDPTKPDLDTDGVAAMRRCWDQNGVDPDTGITDFLNEPEFATQRELVARCLQV